MTVTEYIARYIAQKGITDVFGIPGGVVLDLLYSFDKENDIEPHLTYSEQGAAFAAVGYGQISGRPGVVYSTRGPGVSNMITPIMDAYYDSIPLIVMTSHSSCMKKTNMRVFVDQEVDYITTLSQYTKYSAMVNRVDEVHLTLKRAYYEAISDRPGPVFLDFEKSVLKATMIAQDKCNCGDDAIKPISNNDENESRENEKQVINELYKANRPVLLIGGGVRASNSQEYIIELSNKCSLPVLSSRLSMDVVPDFCNYFGYIGSHGDRTANYILSKADFLLLLGNRASFPLESLSYKGVLDKTKIVRIDVDANEKERDLPNSDFICKDLSSFLPALLKEMDEEKKWDEWRDVCKTIQDKLIGLDDHWPKNAFRALFRKNGKSIPMVCDVGNNTYWVCQEYLNSSMNGRVMFSYSFGSLGCAVPKSIGVYFAERKPVLCFVGDQGIQENIQELQLIGQLKLPITIVLINNHSSGMIMDRERKYPYYLHTTLESGYGVPDFGLIAKAYGLDYYRVETVEDMEMILMKKSPSLVELIVQSDNELFPKLPIGNECQNMYPYLSKELNDYLEKL